MNESVSLALDSDEALVLFELAHRLAEVNRTCLPAECAVLGILITQMERTLSAPFAEEYVSMVDAARSRVAQKWGRT